MKKITLLLSFVACIFVGQAQTQVANIGALRTANSTLAWGATSTATFQITGEVQITFISTSTSQTTLGVKTYYVQDATGAFIVYDSGKLITETYAVNNGIKNVTGKVKNYNGMFELIVSADPGAVTTASLPDVTPVVTTLDQLITYPGQVCTVNNVVISDLATGGNGTFIAGKNFPLTVGGVSSTTVLRTSYYDANYITNTLPTGAQKLTGLVLLYQSSATGSTIVDFIPRSASDITPATGLSNTQATQNLVVSATKNQLKIFNVAEGSNVEIFNALGSRVQNSILNNGLVDLNNLTNGMYIVRIGNQTAKFKI
jgi:hypothetical protein